MESTELRRLEGKNWMAAMALCWGLGSFGAHRFYTGKTTTAWVMVALTVLSFTAPLSAIWALVDGVMLALGKFTHEDGSELYERKPWFGYVYIGVIILGILAVFAYFLLFASMFAAIMGATAGAGAATLTP